MSNPFEGLNINVNMTALLKEPELKNMLTAYFATKGFKVKKVEVKVSTREEGQQRDPYTVASFDGISVELEAIKD